MLVHYNKFYELVLGCWTDRFSSSRSLIISSSSTFWSVSTASMICIGLCSYSQPVTITTTRCSNELHGGTKNPAFGALGLISHSDEKFREISW